MSRDRRYRIALEFCGHAEPRRVVRFCDEWVGQARTPAGAALIRDAHKAKLAAEMEGSACA